jgi:hypothetical protein
VVLLLVGVGGLLVLVQETGGLLQQGMLVAEG